MKTIEQALTDNSFHQAHNIGCDFCVTPDHYKTAHFTTLKNGKQICNYCKNHVRKQFKGIKQLKEDINLKEGEKIGVMVSGGKDGLYAWMTLCNIFGPENVIAFNHHKSGLVHPFAYENLLNASRILKSQLIIVEDNDFIIRFRKNLEAFVKKPDPAMTRVALCAGCRYGITGNLYRLADEKYKIKKFVSAASYLELAPFKAELLKEKGNGNNKYGLLKGLIENEKYNFDDNIEIILNDDDLAYKSISNGKKTISHEFKNYKLFDLDDYIENNPDEYEKAVTERLSWKRPEKSWHFDCIIEEFKDFFYYGTLGYTENEFKLSQMIRYNLISRDDALKEICHYRNKMKNSLKTILQLLDELHLSYLNDEFIQFFKNSKYYQ